MSKKPVRQLIAGAEAQTEFYPKQLMQNVLDGEAGENLYAYLSKFNHINVGYVASDTAAYNAIPEIYRKTGFIITYYLNEKPITKQFIGTKEDAGSENWISDIYWELIDNTGAINNIINYPDDEDLTEVDTGGSSGTQEIKVLKFADKKYNPTNFSGLGRIYLRKNLVEVEQEDKTKVIKNILTQEMINTANARYIIQYDYDLNGETIIVPEECVLQFDGGSLNNGTLEGNNTRLQYKDTYIFGDKLFIDGTWNVDTIKDSMFSNLHYTNGINNIFKLTNPNIVNTIIISDTSSPYYVEITTDNTPALNLNSNTRIILNSTIQLIPNSFENYQVLLIDNCKNITIEGNGSILGDKDSHLGTSGEWGHGISTINSSNISISGIIVENCWGDSIYIGSGSKKITIQHCTLGNSRRQGISVISVDVIRIIGCFIHDISGTAPEAAIDVEPNEGDEVQIVEVKDNIIINCGRGIMGAVNSTNSIDTFIIKNNTISNVTTLAIYLASPNDITSNYKVKLINISNNYVAPVSTGSAIQVSGATLCSIIDNNITQGGALAINTLYGDNFVIKGNYIYNPSGTILRMISNVIFEDNNAIAYMFMDASGGVTRTIRNATIKNNILNTHFRVVAYNLLFCNNRISIDRKVSYLLYIEGEGEFNTIDGNTFNYSYTSNIDHIIYNTSKYSIFTNNIFNIGDELVKYVFHNVGDNCIYSKNRINGSTTGDAVAIGDPNGYYNSSYEEEFVKAAPSNYRPQITPYNENKSYSTRGIAFFDLTVNRPIWWTGSEWITAGGSIPEDSIDRNEDWTLKSKVVII